jgi:hypothetical protein
MKALVQVTEIAGEGLEALLGQNVLLMCANYFYTGKLVGVNTDFVKLENPFIVYETGPWSAPKYQDAQALNAKEWYVTRASIESYGLSK